MKKALSLSFLVVVAILSLACDDGAEYGVPEDAKVVVTIEREMTSKVDSAVKIFAAKFNEEENHLLRFVCPCYFGSNTLGDMLSPDFSVAGQDEIVIKLLPGATYNVYVRHLDGSQEISYEIRMSD